ARMADAIHAETVKLIGVMEDPAPLWSGALLTLWAMGDQRSVVALLRQGVAPPPDYCKVLAEMLDPPSDRVAAGRLSFTRSGKIVERPPASRGREELATRVHRAVAAGEKEYLAVEQVAKKTGYTERHVWKALKELKDGPVRDLLKIVRRLNIEPEGA